jgi:hypothetical protein
VEFARADCPFDGVVLGVGATIPGLSSGLPDQVGLQQVAVAQDGTSAFARASELAGGAGVHGTSWHMWVTAVCADRPRGYEVKWAQSSQAASEPEKTAVARCTTGRELIGSGGSVNTLAVLDVSLRDMIVNEAGQSTVFRGQENRPVSDSWGRVIGVAVCANELSVD